MKPNTKSERQTIKAILALSRKLGISLNQAARLLLTSTGR